LRNDSLNELIKLRKSIHSEPELAGEEKSTVEKVIKFISKFSPDETIKNIGGNGIAFIFKGKEEGASVLFRCELDALPIQEINDFDYISKFKNKGHKCGHDGHMTVLAGLAEQVSSNKDFKGKVILLFQPAEETGEGAGRMINDAKLSKIKPDYVFAFHNLPGYELNSILIRKGSFASASKGMIIKLTGKTSHAAEPENGINPSFAVAEIIKKLLLLPEKLKNKNDFILVTIIHASIGERAFGTSAGYAELMTTLRAFRNDDMRSLISESEEIVKKIASDQKLKVEISYTEEFPATINDNECVEIIKHAAEKNNFSISEIKTPFRWSEDFGHFTEKYKGGLFGIGSGENHPQLHNPDYDFPDEIIPVGVTIFHTIMNEILNRK
jgi:amidohydrolase